MTTIKDQYMKQAKTNVSSYSIKFLKDPDTHKALQDTLVQQAVTLLWREYKSYKGIIVIPRTPQQMLTQLVIQFGANWVIAKLQHKLEGEAK